MIPILGCHSILTVVFSSQAEGNYREALEKLNTVVSTYHQRLNRPELRFMYEDIQQRRAFLSVTLRLFRDAIPLLTVLPSGTVYPAMRRGWSGTTSSGRNGSGSAAVQTTLVCRTVVCPVAVVPATSHALRTSHSKTFSACPPRLHENHVEVFVSDYSYRSATMGSTLAARRAGTKLAPPANAINNNAAVQKVLGSAGEIPKTNWATVCRRNQAPRSPIAAAGGSPIEAG
jgi:hypothetical protein